MAGLVANGGGLCGLFFWQDWVDVVIVMIWEGCLVIALPAPSSLPACFGQCRELVWEGLGGGRGTLALSGTHVLPR